MKNIFDHIEYVKGKPHHIRKRVAFATAAFGSGLVALVWFAGSISANSFAIQGTSFADSSKQQNVMVAPNGSSNQGLAGAAAALQDAKAPAHIEIVDTAPAAAPHQSEQTILPF